MQNDYAAGKKIYNMGMPNAQSGTMRSPTGYVQREQRNQRRSGKAQAILRVLDKKKKRNPVSGTGPVQAMNMAGLDVTLTGQIIPKGR